MLPFTKEELQKEIDLGYVNVQKHKNYDLYIYNYSNKAQFDRRWNEVTLTCRGLILDGDFSVIGRPFKKFFNFEEVNYNVPNESYEVTEKLDGSMFICCLYKHFIITATRGSFNSDQALRGREILRQKYVCNNINPFKKGITYVFEVIYKENKIVIDYGDTEDIILLATIDNETGEDTPGENPPKIGFPIVPFFTSGFGVNKLFDLKKENIKNKEGFVVKFLESGTRIKIKFDDYIRLHKIMTGVTSARIWDILKNNQSLDDFLVGVPDEFYSWIQKTKDDLKYQFNQILSCANKHYYYITSEQKNNLEKFQTKKEIALYIQQNVPKNLQSIIFSMVDGKNYDLGIWKLVKPKSEKAFAFLNKDQ